jgi:hypothetical protein
LRVPLRNPVLNFLEYVGHVEVEMLALAILERKFPQRWAKVSVVAAPPHFCVLNVPGS